MAREPLTISAAAAHTGLSVHTLRCNERIGLLDPVGRASGGHRRFGGSDLERIAFLQRLRATGMPIRDMLRYADPRRRGDSTLSARRRMLEAHRRAVAVGVAALRRDLDAIDAKVAHYRALEGPDEPG